MNSNNNMIELQMELPIEHEKKVFGQFDDCLLYTSDAADD